MKYLEKEVNNVVSDDKELKELKSHLKAEIRDLVSVSESMAKNKAIGIRKASRIALRNDIMAIVSLANVVLF